VNIYNKNKKYFKKL